MNNTSYTFEQSTDYYQKADDLYSTSAKLKWLDLVVKEAHGAIVTDIDGNEFIDLHGNGSCANIGHSHPKVVNAIKEQADNLVHYCPGYFYHDEMIKTMEKLIDITPGDFNKKVVFGNSGSDANDGMMKYARAYTGRQAVIAFDGAYHGTTYGALSLSSCTSNMREGLTPVVSDVYSVPFPNAYRHQTEHETDIEFSERYFSYFTDFLNRTISAENVALVIIEPIQGDSGMIKMPEHYVHLLHDFCQEHGILFGVDEVNQGLGRSGKMWSIEHFDVVPDLLSTAKSLANGMPLSAVVGRSEVMDSLHAPAHLFTTAGNPISCVASQAVIDVIEEENLVERSAKLGEYAKSRFKDMQDKYEVIGDVRIYGLNGAIELVEDQKTKVPDADSTLKIMSYCHQHGVILITLSSNVLRFQPPLNIPKETLDQAFDVIDSAFQALEAGEIELNADEKLGW